LLPFNVRNHIKLLAEAGADVADLQARFDELADRVPEDARLSDPEWQTLEQDVVDRDAALVPADEPWHLDDIRAARPEQRVDRYETAIGDRTLATKVRGGWLGRVAGCVLGKPLEPWLAEPGRYWERLRDHLRANGDYPITDYIREETAVPYWEMLRDSGIAPHWIEVKANWECLRGRIDHAPSDDDISDTVIALRKMQRFGRSFRLTDTLWVYNMYMRRGLTKAFGGTVLRNLALGLDYPEAARFMNTSRELLVPQICSDLYGFVSPGEPEEAARLAWHEGAAYASENGLYGGLWIAACIAAAFAENDPADILTRGLEQIPARCRLAMELRKTMDAARANGDDFDATMKDVVARTGHYHCIHAINNCCIIAAALMHGGGDFSRTICMAVQGGYDTDCNGANAGAVIGVAVGERGIPERWTVPLSDVTHTIIPDEPPLRISELARQTIELAQQRHAETAGRS
jgi:hypothetical protein